MTSPASIRGLRRIMNELRAIEPDFPASYAAVLLFIAYHVETQGEEPNVADIANNTGIHSPSVSRILLTLSDRRLGRTSLGEKRPAGSRKALGLVSRTPDPVDLRMIRLSLTEKGKGLIARMTENLENT